MEILILYSILSYLMMIGITSENHQGNNTTMTITSWVSFLCAPIVLPVLIGQLLARLDINNI